ncbi:MAG: asparagine--tRNA ligase [Planctomycetota bacterium]|nr:MAG: asparagine--tRNA ligase [Planctomycetota bacterium]
MKDYKVVRISEMLDFLGRKVCIQGWVYKRRSKGKIHFIHFRDGSGFVQGVMGKQDVPEEIFEACKTLPQEASVKAYGEVKEDKRAPGGCELLLENVEVVHLPVQEYPIALKEHAPDFLLSHRHLWMRHPGAHATLRVRDRVIRAIREFLAKEGFINVDAPIFTPNACEGTTTLFEVDYFDNQKAYLSQSGQLYMEAAAMAFGKVYCFGPTFRAEKSKTRRHLTEFWMVEPEMAYADLDDVMDLAEDFLCYIVEKCLEDCQQELKTLKRDISKLEKVKKPFPRISYNEALEILKKKGHDFEWGGDFGAPDETALSEEFEKPVMVHRYPAQVKAFYMKEDPEDSRLALCVDVLAPEGYGEIIGGGQRADSLDFLIRKIKEHNLPQEAFEWYLDLRRYGSVPHAGFGLGVERTVAWICGNHHVRECIPFPRTLSRIYP